MKTRDITLMAVMLALLIICSQITVPMWPVPITLQTFAVLLIGMLLNPKQALIVTSFYMILGLVGVPVFSGFSGGFNSFLSPSFGFVISFIPASFVTSLLSRKSNSSLKQFIIAGIVATIVIYAIGVPYLGFILNQVLNLSKSVAQIMQIGMTPFLIGDSIKLVFASLVAVRLTKIVRLNYKPL
ncbi:biotin transporter BioY [Globicatella sanguinis]